MTFVAILLAATMIQRPEVAEVAPGAMWITNPNGQVAMPMTLTHTDVHAQISGFGARVTVEQTFNNPSNTPIEAIYTFPLPDDAAVDKMAMHIGSRTIVGEIKERGEARRVYEAAKAAGQATALLDQERPNIFTQAVANIMPGQRIQVEISYVELLKYSDSQFEFSFPMVVGPRFIGPDTKDPSQIAPPITVQVSLSKFNDATLKALKAVGLKIDDKDATLKVVFGRIDAKLLKKLAAIEQVERIDPLK